MRPVFPEIGIRVIQHIAIRRSSCSAKPLERQRSLAREQNFFGLPFRDCNLLYVYFVKPGGTKGWIDTEP